MGVIEDGQDQLSKPWALQIKIFFFIEQTLTTLFQGGDKTTHTSMLHKHGFEEISVVTMPPTWPMFLFCNWLYKIVGDPRRLMPYAFLSRRVSKRLLGVPLCSSHAKGTRFGCVKDTGVLTK